jgi:hypothetical protein
LPPDRAGYPQGVSPLAVVIAALVLAFGASAFVWGTPILGVPIILVALALMGGAELGRRRQQAKQLQQIRDEAKAEKVEFTPRDKETLTSD